MAFISGYVELAGQEFREEGVAKIGKRPRVFTV